MLILYIRVCFWLFLLILEHNETGELQTHIFERDLTFGKSKRKEIRRMKREGKLGKSQRKEPNPDGYERYGFVRPRISV